MTSTAPPRAAAGVSMKERVSRLPMEAQREFLATLPVSVLQEIIRDEWWWTSRPEQVPPPGDWLIYLVLSGRGWGKALPLDTPIPTPGGWATMGDLRPGDRVFSSDGSVTPVSWVSPVQLGNTCHRVVFSDVAETIADARKICVGGPSGVLRVLQRRGVRYRYIKSPKPQIEFLDTGCLIHIEGADNSDVGRGHNAADVWLDEMAKWPDPRGSWIEGIMPALRVDVPGDHPRAFITTTPKPIALLREWSTRGDGSVLAVRGSTFDNKINLSSLILETLASTYKGTQIGLQELEGVLLDAAVGKVFSQVDINTARVTDKEVPDLRMIVVGVDPGGTGEEDETGIVVVGRDLKYDQYVLGDHTILGVGREAARHCWRIVAQYDANKLIVENTLGKAWVTEAFTDAYKEMCEEGLFPSGSRPPLALIDSKQSKKTRAQPVGMRCEQHRLHFVGTHSLLENQCVEFDPKDKDSPDRFDALVSASRWLMKQEPRRATVTTPTSLRNSAKDGDGGADVLRRLEQELFRW